MSPGGAGERDSDVGPPGAERPEEGPEERLPDAVEEVVVRVLDAADLLPGDRGAVEAELRDHFRDGRDAGRGWGELVERFGDPEAAGRRIARARREGPPGGHRTGRDDDDHARWRMTSGETWTEVRRSARSLLRAPAFSLVVVTTLALGIGANTAVFTVLDAVLLEPLPYEAPGELVRVYESSTVNTRWERNYLRAPAIREYREWDEVFASFGTLYTYREEGGDLTDGDRPERVVVSQADAGFFETMGVPPALGRTFRSDESEPAGEPDGLGAHVAVLSHGLWVQRFAADPGVVGRTIRLDGAPFRVVGVMPASFRTPFGSPPDLWVPPDLRTDNSRNSWGNHYLSGVARLPEGVTVERANSRLQALNATLVEEFPDAEGWTVMLVPLRDDVVGETRGVLLWILAGAVALVLLSACVNVGNLVFARSLGRTRDLAVRSALGSGRGRLVVHLLTESALLAVAGGLAGVAVGWVGVRGLLVMAPDALPAIATPALSPRVFLLALAATAGALLLFGLLPALRLSRAAPADALRSGGRGGTEARRMRVARNGLVVAQVATALLLVVGAGLLARSFVALRSVDLAVDPEGVLIFEIHLPDGRYGDGASRHRFHETFHDRIAELAGVEAVGAVSWLPVNGLYHNWGVSVNPADLDDDASWFGTDIRIFAGDWFDAMGIDVVRGEGPGEMDPDGLLAVWVNESLVEETLGEGEVVGRPLQVGGETRRIAGVVEDVAVDARGGTTRKAYIPHAQYADNRNWALFQTVRSSRDPMELREEMRDVLRGLDPDLVLYRPRTFQGILASARAQDRFATALMGSFALLALLLAAAGTYGTLAEAVARRRREIGIRMALGADAASVRAMIVGSALGMAVFGATLGLGAGWLGARWLESLLFEVEPDDPLVFGAAVGILMAAAAAAAWVPAHRATRVDPARTLGAE